MICPLQTAAHHLCPHPPIKSQSEPEVSRLAFHAPEWGCNALTDEKRASSAVKTTGLVRRHALWAAGLLETLQVDDVIPQIIGRKRIQ